MSAHLYDGYGTGTAYVWWFRWHGAGHPGKWLVGVTANNFRTLQCLPNLHAVIDDFGNLVEVPR